MNKLNQPRTSIIVIFAILISIGSTVVAQPDPLIAKAKTEFDKANYPQAIDYLNRARAESPDNAEVYYYLGFYLHYLCYDSVPLTGYDRSKSDEVLAHLKKAIELDPHLGNARYFLGAEYGVRARDAMREGDCEGAVEEFRKGKLGGGYPDWMIEYGRNELRSCQPNAILFVAGDAETNSIEYLQCVEQYRTDVTVIPSALLGRPWALTMFKNGVEGCIFPAPISWSDYQISEMRPYKWKQNKIRVPIAEAVRKSFGIEQDTFEWVLGPNLGEGEEPRFLDACRAALADIITTNQWQRPIYFSTGCPVPEGLEGYIQTSGFVRRLLPYDAEADVDINVTESLLLDGDSYRSFPTLADSDMPRVSHLLQNYRALFLTLTYYYVLAGDMAKAKTVLTAMKSNLPEDILPIPANYKDNIARFEQLFEQGK